MSAVPRKVRRRPRLATPTTDYSNLMSLKHFHIVFIVLAVLSSLGFGAWALLSDVGVASSSIRITGWLSLVIGAGLAVYGVWFFRKSKHVIT